MDNWQPKTVFDAKWGAMYESLKASLGPGESAVVDAAHGSLMASLGADGPAVVALKGHLIIEERLFSLLGYYLPHPEYLNEVRFGFLQKVALVRSFLIDHESRNHPIW